MSRPLIVRQLLLSVVLGSTLALACGGCHSCSSCHDNDSPVANCNCGCGRTGSVSHCGACSPCDNACPSNCNGGACGSGGAPTSNCNCGNNQGAPSDEYLENAPEAPQSPEYQDDSQ